MADCYPDVWEACPHLAGNVSQWEQLFSALGTQLGVAAAPTNRMVQFPWSQKICLASSMSQRSLPRPFCVQKCVLVKRARRLKKKKKGHEVREMQIAEALPQYKEQIIVLRGNTQPSRASLGFTGDPLPAFKRATFAACLWSYR